MGRAVCVEDLGRIAWPLEPNLSSDGKQLAFVQSGPDIEANHIGYEVMVGGVSGRAFESISPGRTRRPVWSPSSGHLAYLVDSADAWQLATINSSVDGSSFGGAIVDFDWLVDSQTLAVLSHDGNEVGLSVVDADSLVELERCGVEGSSGGLVAASPTGEVVAMAMASHDETRSEIRLWNIGEQASELFWTWSGHIHRLAWSRDGLRLAVLVNPMPPGLWPNNEIWVLDTREESSRRIGAGLDLSFGQAVRGDDERGIEPVHIEWDQTGEAVYSVFSSRGRSVLGLFDEDGSHEVFATRDGSILDYSTTGQTRDIVVSWSSPTSPGELSLLTSEGEQQLTSINAEWLDEVELSPTKQLEAGGVQGWLTTPSTKTPPDRSPLVVQVHGGPHYPVGERFSFDSQRLASHGMATLRSNPRGSQGYGVAHAESIVEDWGGPDHVDVLAITDAAVDTGLVDPKPIAIIGESYGGYMVNWAVTQSRKYGVGVSENGVSDLVSLADGPRGETFWRLELGGDPSESHGLYEDRSPIAHASEAKASILLIHAEEDDNVPVAQSRTFVEALSDSEADVSLFLIPGEGHMINVHGKPSSRIVRTKKLDRFLTDNLIQTGEDIHS